MTPPLPRLSDLSSPHALPLPPSLPTGPMALSPLSLGNVVRALDRWSHSPCNSVLRHLASRSVTIRNTNISTSRHLQRGLWSKMLTHFLDAQSQATPFCRETKTSTITGPRLRPRLLPILAQVGRACFVHLAQPACCFCLLYYVSSPWAARPLFLHRLLRPTLRPARRLTLRLSVHIADKAMSWETNLSRSLILSLAPLGM